VVARHSKRAQRQSGSRVRRFVAWGGAVVLVGFVAAVGAANVISPGSPTSTVPTFSRLTSTTTTLPGATATSTSTTSPTSTTTTILGATTTTTAPQTVTISAAGDTELGNTPDVPANPLAYFEPMKAALAAPIEFANLEGTMTSRGSSKCSPGDDECFAFHVPPSFARVYREMGFTVLNSANNHSHDYGDDGVIDTSNALRGAGIAQAGLPGQIAVVRDGKVKVAFVDFAPYTNTNDLLNFPEAKVLIDKARRLASIVVVYMHAGAEGATADHVTKANEFYVGENRGNPYLFAHDAINEGASLVIASGPHVLRGIEFYHGHLIDYSLGDFVNFNDFAASGDLTLSAILHVTLSAKGAFLSGTFTSVKLTESGQGFVDPTHAAATFVNQLSREDFGSNAVVIDRNGTLAPPK
jgi:poly-gamma-glutamate capsule biosynthesis protein CapA/YwtB (metallophosphatase superfamily)